MLACSRRVVAAAQEQLNCSTLQGAELENEGTAASVGAFSK
jgi:hypothetical protein